MEQENLFTLSKLPIPYITITDFEYELPLTER